MTKHKGGSGAAHHGATSVAATSAGTGDARVQCVAEIARLLVKAYEEKAKVNIVRMRQAAASKYGCVQPARPCRQSCSSD